MPVMTREEIAEHNPEMLFLDEGDFDDALVGVGERCGQPALAVYDREKCIKILMRRGMGHDSAEEFFDFNIAGAWVGPQTPIILSRA